MSKINYLLLCLCIIQQIFSSQQCESTLLLSPTYFIDRWGNPLFNKYGELILIKSETQEFISVSAPNNIQGVNDIISTLSGKKEVKYYDRGFPVPPRCDCSSVRFTNQSINVYGPCNNEKELRNLVILLFERNREQQLPHLPPVELMKPFSRKKNKR